MPPIHLNGVMHDEWPRDVSVQMYRQCHRITVVVMEERGRLEHRDAKIILKRVKLVQNHDSGQLLFGI
jgi:hypothetical protein